MTVRPIDGNAIKHRVLNIAEAWKEVGQDRDALLVKSVVEKIVDTQPTLTPPNDMDLGFDVIDAKTGEYPDLEKIALTEEWAQGLVYCDMDGFAVREDGSLILLDECGNCVSCPPRRFEIRLQDGGDSTEGQIAMEGMKDDH